MPAIVLVGAQWGDEGKGKATDLMGGDVDYVVKFNGGNNAGHTVVIEGEDGTREKYALHLLPSGILTPTVTPVIGNGVVVDLEVLFQELDGLEARGVDTSRLVVSANAHVIAPYNRTLDKVTERFLGARRIGTTGRGIGPTYADKMNRVGIRVQDLFDEGILRQKVEAALSLKNQVLVKIYNTRAAEADRVVEELLGYAERLRPMVADTSLVLEQALDAGSNVLLEAGPGDAARRRPRHLPVRDVVVGDGRRRVHRVRHPADAGRRGSSRSSRRTRRGSARARSPPSCSTTTARRCARPVPSTARPPGARAAAAGWTRSSAATPTGSTASPTSSSPSSTCSPASTKVPVCVAYEVDGVRHDEMPVNQSDFHHAKPVYELLDGWSEDISECREFEDLPAAAQAYVLRVEELVGARVSAIGVGPGRHEIIQRHPLLD